MARLLAALAIALVPVAAARAAGLEAATVRAPKSGKYAGVTGQDQKLTLYVSGKSVQIVAFKFACGRKAIGSTSVQAIPLKRTDEGYRFKTSANSIVSYSDEQPDENGPVYLRGRFSRSGKSVVGLLRVQTKRCHDTGYVDWHAKR